MRAARALATVAGAVTSALLASLCCIGPLVFAALGIGGAGLLVRFEPYRPLFSVLTLGMLGTGFYFTYRTPRAATGPDCNCPVPRASRLGKSMLWLATVVALLLLTFPLLAEHLG